MYFNTLSQAAENLDDPKKPAWADAVEVVFDLYDEADEWERIAIEVADGRPSEIDYVLENWPVDRLAERYAHITHENGIKYYDPDKKRG